MTQPQNVIFFSLYKSFFLYNSKFAFFERFFKIFFFSNFGLIMVPDHITRKKTPKLAVLGHESENLTCFEDFQLFDRWYVFSMKTVKAILLPPLMTYFCSFFLLKLLYQGSLVNYLEDDISKSFFFIKIRNTRLTFYVWARTGQTVKNI